MMKIFKLLTVAAVLPLMIASVQAADLTKGERTFKRCLACHSITGDDGAAIVKGGKIGPNLYGVVGRGIGSLEGFSYGESMAAVGQSGVVWDEEKIAAFLTDPAAWLAEATGDSAAKTMMTFKLKKGGADLAAYLAKQKPE